MKRFLRNLSIRRKQALILMVTSGVALLVVSATVIIVATYDFRGELVEGMNIQAAMVGSDARAAIDFNDARSAEESLASLQAEPEALAACVYDREGRLFATYRRADLTNEIPYPPMQPTGHQFVGDNMITFHALKDARGTSGGVCVISSLEEVPAHALHYTGVVGVVFVLAMVAVFFISNRLQRMISGPILHLAGVVHSVSADKNYALRAAKEGNDEIGQLVDGFNEMLTQIQARELALQSARENLERRVEQRTEELQSEVAERRQTQAALEESQALYHSLVEQLPMGVFRKDREGRYVFVNSWLCRLKNIQPGEMLGKTPHELAAAEQAGPDAMLPDVIKLAGQGTDHHHQIIETGQQIEVEEEYPTVDGKPRYLQVVKTPVRGLDGEIIGSQAIMFDVTARKRAEAALQESQALYSSLVEQMPTGIFRKDLQGRYVFVNARFCEIKGLTPEEMVGKTPREVAVGASTAAQIAWAEGLKTQGVDHHQTILETGRHIEIEEEYLATDGTRHHLHVVKLPVFGPEGGIIGSQGIMIDITERKHAEAEAAYERDLLKALLDNIPDTIYFKDAESRFVRVSRSKLQKEYNIQLKIYQSAHPHVGPENLPLHLSTIEQFETYMKGKTDADFVPAETAREFFEEEQRIIHTGEPMIGNMVKSSLAGGRTGWYLSTKLPWRDKDGKIVGTFGTSKDVTSIKEAEAKLAEASALMDTLLANSPDYIYFKDLKSRFIRCSASMAGMFKVASVDEVIGKTDRDFFAEAHAGPAYEEEQHIIRTGKPMVGKTEKETWPDGHVTWALTTKMPLHNGVGEIIGTFGISKDITPIKDAEARLKEVHHDLVQTSRRAGMADVATSVLHNVGNVLNSVNTSADLLAERLRKSRVTGISRVAAMFEENQNDLAGFLGQEGRRDQLVNYLKTLSQHVAAEQGTMLEEAESLGKNVQHIKEIVAMQQTYAKVSGVREVQSASLLMEDAIRMHAAGLTRHDVQLIRDYQPIPDVSLDKHKVLQILVNMISNAKYAMADTVVTDRRLVVAVALNGDQRLRFIVKDNGMGIAPENLTRIFSLGFTTRDNGHGFGLHSGFLAAREMGGELRVQSDGPGHGATFTLELPVLPEITP